MIVKNQNSTDNYLFFYDWNINQNYIKKLLLDFIHFVINMYFLIENPCFYKASFSA